MWPKLGKNYALNLLDDDLQFSPWSGLDNFMQLFSWRSSLAWALDFGIPCLYNCECTAHNNIEMECSLTIHNFLRIQHDALYFFIANIWVSITNTMCFVCLVCGWVKKAEENKRMFFSHLSSFRHCKKGSDMPLFSRSNMINHRV